MMLTYAEMAAEVMDHFIDADHHGYSQPNRDGDGTVETITLSDGTQVSFNGGDRDCSRLVQTCYVCVGVLPRGIHFYTGNERDILLANGFTEIPVSSARRGDVLLKSGHTEMHLGAGMQGGARIDESGTIYGRTKGDQTGQEVTRSAFVASQWSSAYRCVAERPGIRPVQVPGDTMSDGGIWYRAHVAGVGWMDPVHDGQVAGTVGYSTSIEALKVSPPKGLVLDAIAHCQNIGSLAFEDIRTVAVSGTASSDGDPIIGTVGRSLRMEAITLHAKTNETGKRLLYQGHVQDVGWTDVCEAGQRCGTRGESRRLEAVKIWLA